MGLIDFENATLTIKADKQEEWGTYRCPDCASHDIRMGIEEMELSWDQHINPNTGEITLMFIAERGELWDGWIMCENCGNESFNPANISTAWKE